MAIWRPAAAIRVKAIGIAWRRGRLLAAEVLDDAGRVKGLRPLGGAVKFGERWRDALVREFREELGIAVCVIGDPVVLENIFHHEGALGHEIVHAAQVVLPDGALPGLGPVPFREDDGTPAVARWVDPAAAVLFPEGLADRLGALSGG